MTGGTLAGDLANELAEANERIATLTAANEQLQRKVMAARAERDALHAALQELKNQRIVSVVFGHHKGAPRPFALRGDAGITLALGAEWPDGAVALRWVIPGLEGGWHTRQSGGVDGLNTSQQMLDGTQFQVVWLSDDLGPLAAAEQEGRQVAAAAVRALAAPGAQFPRDLCRSPYWSSLSGPYAEGYIEWCARAAEGPADESA